VNCDEFKELDYSIKLKSGGNRVLTPLEIPDFKELSSGSTKNKESIGFVVTRNKDEADELLIEVFDGATLLFSDIDTSGLLSGGDWQWDGYDRSDVLDTKVLKSQDLKVRLTARNTQKEQVKEFKLSNKANEVDWVDAKVDRNAQTVEVTVRPSFSDGGISGDPIPGYTPKTFGQLEAMAKQGIEMYWTRDGSRANGTNSSVKTAKGKFKVTVIAEVNAKPQARNFPLIENLDNSFGRSTSLLGFQKIYHNPGWGHLNGYSGSDVDALLKHTAAHEFGHLVLNEYGKSSNPDYSWTHKGTSTEYTQKKLPGNPYPTGTADELDLMKYYSTTPPLVAEIARSIAATEDVKGLLWLNRIYFND
jgi:hypothetical protein